MLIGDHAGQLKSKDLNEFIKRLGVINIFSIAYEQWQNGLAESSQSIHFLMRIARYMIWD
jgi:transposase InsO family protein